MARNCNTVTDCECLKAGYCQRHGIYKTEHWVDLCRTRKDYFTAWEAGKGPGQQSNPVSASTQQRIIRSDNMIANLLIVCKQCVHFNGNHCKLAIGGCFSSRRQCWERWLREKDCPKGLWS